MFSMPRRYALIEVVIARQVEAIKFQRVTYLMSKWT